VYLYGPPAAGKLTVATRLADRTGARLFHNHLTVNALRPIFPFGSSPFTAVLHRLRLDVFATAARTGLDLVFTNNAAWSGPDGRRRFETFAAAVEDTVADNGGTTKFVQITAPTAVLERRLANDSRRAHGKLVDAQRLRDLLVTYDPTPLHPDDLVVDTAAVTADEAARRIATALTLRRDHSTHEA